MKNDLLRIADITIIGVWSIFMSVRIHYPKQYPPLDLIGIIITICLVIDIIFIRWYFHANRSIEALPLKIAKTFLVLAPALEYFIIYHLKP